jgi:hypothetical protein
LLNIFYAISTARPYATSGGSHRGSGNLRALASVLGLAQLGLGITVGFLSLGSVSAQDLSLSPTRPTVANGVSIQDKGVLQVETGYDAYPQRVPGDQQTVAGWLSYVPLEWLRLDYGWSAFSHQESEDGTASGVGTIQVGGKVVLFKRTVTERHQGLLSNMRPSFPRLPIGCCKVSVNKSFCS